MLETLVLLAGLQQLELSPRTVEVGEAVQVRAVDSKGAPIAGLRIERVGPDGESASLGETDAAGALSFLAESVGSRELRAEIPSRSGVPGVRLVRLYEVVPQPRRWLYALVCVPLGLALLWRNLRRLLRPEPCRRAP